MFVRKGSLGGYFGETLLDAYLTRFQGITVSNFVRAKRQIHPFSDAQFLLAIRKKGVYGKIVYSSEAFSNCFGYSKAELMQQTAICDFLFGPLTKLRAQITLRDAILHCSVQTQVYITLYTKTGTIFIQRIKKKNKENELKNSFSGNSLDVLLTLIPIDAECGDTVKILMIFTQNRFKEECVDESYSTKKKTRFYSLKEKRRQSMCLRRLTKFGKVNVKKRTT